MNAPIDTLAFAARFEGAGFDHDQARALAAAFADAQESTRAGLVTKADLELGLAGLEGRINKQLGDFESRLAKQMGDLEVRLTRHTGEIGRDVTGRLWSAIAIIAGVSTAISATIGAGMVLLTRSGVFG